MISHRGRGMMVEHSIGNGEVDSSHNRHGDFQSPALRRNDPAIS
jgi:hypothetical protein